MISQSFPKGTHKRHKLDFNASANEKNIKNIGFLFQTEIQVGALEPPLFTERFQELTVPEKGTIKLFAKVTGNPRPQVYWLR